MKVGAKERKYILMGGGLIAVLVVLYVLFADQLGGGGIVDTVESKKIKLRHQLETKMLEDPYESYLQLYDTRLKEDRAKLLPGDNPNVAESELLKVLTDFAEKNGVEITQKIVQNELKVEDQLYKVSARIVAQCNSEQLVQFLTDIRNYNRFLTIDEFTIQTRTSRNQTNTELRPSLTVSGYISSSGSGTEGVGPDSNL